MKTSSWAILIIIVLVIIGGFWYFHAHPGTGTNVPTTTATSTTTGTSGLPAQAGPTTTPTGLTFDPGTYSLAVTAEPLLVTSYIPPCDDGFDYCIYKNDSEFAGTNFDSAGISITHRPDLTTQTLCLQTPPSAYAGSLNPTSKVTADAYAASVFANLGNGAAGHSAIDSYYHLFDRANSTCTELDVRVSQTAYGNYPTGTIQQFTTADQVQVSSELMNILDTMQVGSTTIVWPKTTTS